MKAHVTIITGRKKRTAKLHAGYDPEKRIGMVVRSGAIASAGKRAIAASFKKGLSVTVLEGGIIFRLHPDGTKTAIKKIAPVTTVYTSGKMVIK